jgi:hypothetical protein
MDRGAVMQLSWNDRYRDLIAGLDILGVRQLDQSLEVQLVGGLTTVAPRARYISLLTWALASLYRRLLQDGGGELHWSDERQNEMLTRLEFLVAAATQSGAHNAEGGSPTGIVGSDVYRSELEELAAGGDASFPSPRRPGVLNAYGSPTQGFGLLASVDEGAPLALTPRGQELMECMVVPDDVQRLLFEGEQLTPSLLNRVQDHFSLNGLRGAEGEREALLQALDQPVGRASEARSDRFRATRRWVLRQLELQAADGDGLVDRAYAHLASESSNDDIARLWGEVAWRKRVHFALELLLAALANSLELDRGTAIETVVARLAEDLRERPPEVVAHVVGDQPLDLAAPWREFRTRVDPQAFVDTPPRRNLGRLPPAWQLGAALCLLSATEQQTRRSRTAGWAIDRGPQAAESAFRAMLDGHDRPTADVAVDLLRNEVAHRHLRHTMRKMSQRQSNSLRFFPRGDLLVPTGTETAAGFSLTRLSAVLQVMADLGHLEAAQGGFRPTKSGLAWAAEMSP